MAGAMVVKCRRHGRQWALENGACPHCWAVKLRRLQEQAPKVQYVHPNRSKLIRWYEE